MDLEDIDKLIADRKERIDKRKEDGTLFEEEVASEKGDDIDSQLEEEVKSTKEKMNERMKSQIPPCPQCGEKMTLMPDQGMIVCQDCGIGMRVSM